MHEVDVGLSVADRLRLYLVLRFGDHALCVPKSIFNFAMGKQCKHLDPLLTVPLRKLHLKACLSCLCVYPGPHVPELLLFLVFEPSLSRVLFSLLSSMTSIQFFDKLSV